MVRQRVSASERRQDMLEQATRLFAEKGFDGTTTAAVARACGTSEALLFKVFGSKRELYRAILEHKVNHTGWGQLDFEPGPEEDDRAYFTRVARAIFEQVAADPDFVRLLIYSDLQGSQFAELFHEARGGECMAQVRRHLEARRRAGALRALDPDVACLSFLLSIWQLALCRIFPLKGVSPELDDEALIDTVVSIFLGGVLA